MLKFVDFAAQTLAEIDESKPRRIIVDLRFNQGGNSAILKPLTAGLAARRKIIGVPFVLIGSQTFSSGVWAANDLRNEAKNSHSRSRHGWIAWWVWRGAFCAGCRIHDWVCSVDD